MFFSGFFVFVIMSFMFMVVPFVIMIVPFVAMIVSFLVFVGFMFMLPMCCSIAAATC